MNLLRFMGVFKIIIYVWKRQNQIINGTAVNTDYEKVAAIDYAASVIWVSRYRECGEFEIYIPASNELVELFQGDVIFTRDECDTIMILEKFKLTTDEEAGDFLILSGRSLESIFERRVVKKQINLDGTLGEGVSTLLTACCMSPEKYYADRVIPELRVNNLSEFTEPLGRQITGDTLLSVFQDICTSYDCGFKLTCNDSPNRFNFSLYRGLYKSETVIFSPQFGNLSKSEFTYDYTNYFNLIYTAGEGEGKDRVVIEYESDDVDYRSLIGLNRREYWLDERNCSSNSEHPQSDTYYFAVLQEKGREKCKELRPFVEFTGEIVDNGMYKYRVDYELGDTVLIENEYGIQAKAVISEITEVEDEEGYRIVPVLSKWVTIGSYYVPVHFEDEIIEEVR